ncbi:MAG: hypothetical protein PHO63_05930 [Bacilli bacterium]|nr:hypothetical protein [Bacilli bacterium]MDD4809488.1 hypothetical protein [Bacilli bacterium]
MNYDRVILEMLDRIKKLESTVEKLEKGSLNVQIKNIDQPSFNVENIQNGLIKKDNTKYIFNGIKYSKRRLVLAIVKEYVKHNPKITVNELQTVFDSSLQGSFGVIVEKSIATKTSDYEKRFFAKKDEEINLIDGVCVVCSQWTLTRINGFIVRVRQLGFEITEIR